MYATVADLSGEGVAAGVASEARLLQLLDEATRTIDRLTGWFFEPRQATLRLDGRGTPSLELPVPPIRLHRLTVEGRPCSFAAKALVFVGAPVGPGFHSPRLTLRHGAVFPRGQGNVVAEGRWGFTEEDGSPEGRTPPAIRRACLLLVLRNLPPLAEDASLEARNRWRLLEERTRDQSYRLDTLRQQTRPLSGDPEIDALLEPYRRPSSLGAA